MKSGKQRRTELDARKAARSARATSGSAARAAASQAEVDHRERERARARGVMVNRAALAPHNSYGEPDFVIRGFYTDRPFACVDCRKAEVWTAAQQKWWYEVAKGDVFATARRCRSCRRRERVRKAEARRVHLAGLARKHPPRPG
jgi:hypothetical protein